MGLSSLAVQGHWHLFFTQSMKFRVSSGSISSLKKLSFSRRSLRWFKPLSHKLQQEKCDFHRGAIVFNLEIAMAIRRRMSGLDLPSASILDPR